MNDRLFEKTFSNREDLNKSQVASECERIVARLRKEPSYPDTNLYELIDGSLVDDLELSFLWLYLQMCYAQEQRAFDSAAASFRDPGHEIFEAYPCKAFYNRQYRALLIDTPTILGSYRTYANKAKENLVKDLVLLSVRKYLSESGEKAEDLISVPFAVCLYRRCLPNQSSATVPDIDNIEARKIINVLVRELDLDDSYNCLITSINSIEYVEDKESAGTSVVLISEETRLDFEREYLASGRSLDFIRTTVEQNIM